MSMITAKGLVLRLRKMRVWTRFQKNLKKDWKDAGVDNYWRTVGKMTCYGISIVQAFPFPDEDFDFWHGIANKIDEVQL